jgi:hypothetical protein
MHDINKIIEEHKGKDICILGNGTTTRIPNENKFFDYSDYKYLWTVNRGWIQHPTSNLGFMMDDWCSIAHDTDLGTREHKEEDLKKAKIPIITNTKYPGFDSFVEYPIKKVINHTHRAYFGETLSYMVAFAILCEVKSIQFHGTDYLGTKAAERACTEGWVAIAQERGIRVGSNSKSHFLQTQLDDRNNFIPNFYGYIPETFPFSIEKEENGITRISTRKDNGEIEEFKENYKLFLEERNGHKESKAS